MKLSFISFSLSCLLLLSCQNNKELQIIIGEKATQTEKITAEDLKTDLSKTTDLNITIISEKEATENGKKS